MIIFFYIYYALIIASLLVFLCWVNSVSLPPYDEQIKATREALELQEALYK